MSTQLDKYGKRIRSLEEIKEIEISFEDYQLTKRITYIQKYVSEYKDLKILLDSKAFSIHTLAFALWDDLHPLSKSDLKRWQKKNCKKIRAIIKLG